MPDAADAVSVGSGMDTDASTADAPVVLDPAVAAVRRRTLVTASASTLLVLAAFVTPLNTGVRTAADLA
nr:hypothetical protein [Geodermatophilaceae bacterium]